MKLLEIVGINELGEVSCAAVLERGILEIDCASGL